jgi:hypothetical protein
MVPRVDVVVFGDVRVQPAVHQVERDGVIDVGVVDARGVFVRACDVGREAVPHLAVLHLFWFVVWGLGVVVLLGWVGGVVVGGGGGGGFLV